MTGLEPATFWSRTRRSTKLSYIPTRSVSNSHKPGRLAGHRGRQWHRAPGRLRGARVYGMRMHCSITAPAYDWGYTAIRTTPTAEHALPLREILAKQSIRRVERGGLTQPPERSALSG
jgi:hypothetical protein